MTAGIDQAVHPLLVELFTEELPPKALRRLGEAFANGIAEGLRRRDLLTNGATHTPFATPRRLAVLIDGVKDKAPDKPFREKLMPVPVGLDADGKPTPALTKRLAAKGLSHIDPATLKREVDGKHEQLVYHGIAAGAMLADGLQEALNDTLQSLPIPKVMSYQLADGETTVRFVRPAHGLVALHGEHVVPVTALGLEAGSITHGHRFQAKKTPLNLTSAASYEADLERQGNVVASFEKRRAMIESQLRAHAEALNASLGEENDIDPLLDEVTALVEYPTVYAGEFEPEFLEVPQECLILTMRLNQKYFPLFEREAKKLTNRFLIVSNMNLSDPSNIIHGNQRVVRPRLADARFFYDTDRTKTLASRVESLDEVVYHNKLGSQLQRSKRVAKVARWVAEALGSNPEYAERAALLAKTDLVTHMVGEFPELQGVMGGYYAAHDGEPDEVVQAIRMQYRIRVDQPLQSSSATAAALYLAERAETLVGIWAIGLAPTGDRDPFGLRRAALGVISAFEQLTAGELLSVSNAEPTLTLDGLLRQAAAHFGHDLIPADRVEALVAELTTFVYERYRNQLDDTFDRTIIDAVLAVRPPLHQVPARVKAVAEFRSRPEASSLAAANKRIGNLLKKAHGVAHTPDPALLQEPAEKALVEAIASLQPLARQQAERGDFAGALATLSRARETVDTFFNEVMVMVDDPEVRNNRLAILAALHGLLNRVADIGRLA